MTRIMSHKFSSSMKTFSIETEKKPKQVSLFCCLDFFRNLRKTDFPALARSPLPGEATWPAGLARASRTALRAAVRRSSSRERNSRGIRDAANFRPPLSEGFLSASALSLSRSHSLSPTRALSLARSHPMPEGVAWKLGIVFWPWGAVTK